MFRKPPLKVELLDAEIEFQLKMLRTWSATHENYNTVLDRVERLHKMQEDEKPARVSRETWALIGANLIGIAVVLTHEYTHPITTKALNLAMNLPRIKP